MAKALQSRLTEALSEQLDTRTAEIMAELRAVRAELTETREQLAHAILMYEIRQRRDTVFAGEARAARETEAFAAEHLARAKQCPNPEATILFATERVTLDGPIVQVGTSDGSSLARLVGYLRGREILAFGMSSGLPEDWRPGFPAGSFAQDGLPEVRGATIVDGPYEQTLPEFKAQHPEPIALLYLDTTIYSSTATVLDLLEDQLATGTIIVFDEYFNYPGWQDGEFRAWAEFVERSGIKFRYEGYTFDNEQVVVSVQR
jgi:hypothetical protein